jgi:hypothetical protein
LVRIKEFLLPGVVSVPARNLSGGVARKEPVYADDPSLELVGFHLPYRDPVDALGGARCPRTDAVEWPIPPANRDPACPGNRHADVSNGHAQSSPAFS